jgi:hypothetical protein
MGIGRSPRDATRRILQVKGALGVAGAGPTGVGSNPLELPSTFKRDLRSTGHAKSAGKFESPSSGLREPR